MSEEISPATCGCLGLAVLVGISLGIHFGVANRNDEENVKKLMVAKNTGKAAAQEAAGPVKVKVDGLEARLKKADADVMQYNAERTRAERTNSSALETLTELQQGHTRVTRRMMRDPEVPLGAYVEKAAQETIGNAPGTKSVTVTSGTSGYEVLVTMEDKLSDEQKRAMVTAVDNFKNTVESAWVAKISYKKSTEDAALGPLAKLDRGRLLSFLISFYGTTGDLPAPEKGIFRGGAEAVYEVTNGTSHTLTVNLFGASQRDIVLSPGGSQTVRLLPGTYYVSAKVGDPSVTPFSGSNTFEKGYEYGIRFYIQTSDPFGVPSYPTIPDFSNPR